MVNFKREILWFVSGPLRPDKGETVKQNALEIVKYVRVLERAGLCVSAPYLGVILGDVSDDRKEDERLRGMEIDLQILSRFDGDILVGKRFSNGMQGEASLATELTKPVYDLVGQDLSQVYENALLLKKYELDVVSAIPGKFGSNMLKW